MQLQWVRVSPVRCCQDYIGGIRKAYEEDWYASNMRERQMAVALYFIDKLALRAGHEKDEDEADTVGCCTLKVPTYCVWSRFHNKLLKDPSIFRLPMLLSFQGDTHAHLWECHASP